MILKGGSGTRTLSSADPKDALIVDNFMCEILVLITQPTGQHIRKPSRNILLEE